jgi:hypothetical protein
LKFAIFNLDAKRDDVRQGMFYLNKTEQAEASEALGTEAIGLRSTTSRNMAQSPPCGSACRYRGRAETLSAVILLMTPALRKTQQCWMSLAMGDWTWAPPESLNPRTISPISHRFITAISHRFIDGGECYATS